MLTVGYRSRRTVSIVVGVCRWPFLAPTSRRRVGLHLMFPCQLARSAHLRRSMAIVVVVELSVVVLSLEYVVVLFSL